MKKDDLVICYYEGTSNDLNGIKVTIKSLREHYFGEIVVLYNNVSSNFLDFLKTQNINLIDCSSYNVIFKTSAFNNKIIYTFLFFKKNFELLQNKNILFCDIGDFYFAINPFNLKKDAVVLGLETLKLGECDTNATWINICYNNHILNQISSNIVINSGFILGPFEKIYSLFETMINELQSILSKINYPITDQAIVNKLVYIDKFDVFLEKKHINNMAQKNDDTIKPINHQYNKIQNKKLMNFLYKKYE